jgi:hypothetical protein
MVTVTVTVMVDGGREPICSGQDCKALRLWPRLKKHRGKIGYGLHSWHSEFGNLVTTLTTSLTTALTATWTAKHWGSSYGHSCNNEDCLLAKVRVSQSPSQSPSQSQAQSQAQSQSPSQSPSPSQSQSQSPLQYRKQQAPFGIFVEHHTTRMIAVSSHGILEKMPENLCAQIWRSLFLSNSCVSNHDEYVFQTTRTDENACLHAVLCFNYCVLQ